MKKIIGCFFGKTGYVALEGPLMLNGIHQFVCWMLSLKLGETTQTSKSSFYMTNPALMPHNKLSSFDFFLFRHIKNKIRGKGFSSPEEAVKAFKSPLLEVPHSEWKKCFEDWSHQMQKCIDFKGEYFEKQ